MKMSTCNTKKSIFLPLNTHTHRQNQACEKNSRFGLFSMLTHFQFHLHHYMAHNNNKNNNNGAIQQL